MNKTVKRIILIAIIIVVIVLAVILKKYREGVATIPSNDPMLVGNTAGNLYNNGYFVEDGGKVYFSNTYDGNNIYVMNPDQSDCHKFASGKTSFLNVAGDYVYYYTATSGQQAGLGYVCNGKGFFRTGKDGKHTFSLSKATTDSMMLVGNRLYYTVFEESDLREDSALVEVRSITTANTDEELNIEDHIKLGGYANGIIYYGGMTGDHHLHALDTTTGATYIVNEDINVYLPIIYDNKVYYLDLDDEYTLKAMSLTTGEITTIIDERIDTYNLYNGNIFYQTVGKSKEEYALKRANASGGDVMIIKNGVFENINCTSTYTYFTEFGNDITTYMVPTSGGVTVSTFDAAETAAFKELKK